MLYNSLSKSKNEWIDFIPLQVLRLSAKKTKSVKTICLRKISYKTMCKQKLIKTIVCR